MDTGPFFSSGIAGKNQTLKGLSIKLGTNASVCFDTELMRMSYGWTGDFFACQPIATAVSHTLDHTPRNRGLEAEPTIVVPGTFGLTA